MKLYNIALITFISLVFLGCKKYADDYKSFLDNKEVKYSGKIQNPGYNTGNLRAELFWHPSPDPSIVKYVISWNNGENTMEIAATTHNPTDLVKVIVPNLNEYVYAFLVVSYDSEGNKSVATAINNVRVYGSTYINTLLNRGVNVSEPYRFLSDGSLQLNFNKRDTMNVATTIRYTNVANAIEERQLLADNNSILIPNYKPGTAVQYRSSYIPEVGSIDNFNVTQFSNFPTIIKITELDKSLFRSFKLPTDISDEYGWKLENLWDNNNGTGGGDPAGFHTGGSGLPQSFTIDMGQTVKLDNFRLWQRDNALYNSANLKIFEVWGSSSPNPNGSFDSSWTKMGTFTSVKPSGLPTGQLTDADRAFARAGEKFTFSSSIPQVKYLRFKVLETWGGANYIHLLELSFYKNE
ncbi:hypothetical protein FBD94_19610 [Pedobacter hiemivivus]|uniref:DUF5000 domain-containing protein n=1 Tax=Pedobacter hiemivivus TaxID=2530454 RepID=A0A4R0MK01_9SPHI|nr:DUF4998 domain-containing protein [Pedobacter hiemivivus]TCC86344.1 hypothetical protein EZ444_23870 [Pedobacter hiemivivus]TKC58156.1 hypothetical protein FBD94_19610 [Pedobacter hiemivivus]